MLASHKAYKKCLLGTYSFYMVPCLARSRLTGLRSFFSQAMLASKKAPSPSAHSRQAKVVRCEFR